MSRNIFVLTLLFFLAGVLHAANLPEGFAELQIADGLDPTAMTMASDGRIFITEKSGAVRIVEDGILLEEPFAILDVDFYNERGLGGIVFHPEFEFNNFIYFFYTVPFEGHNRIVRLTANGNFAVPGSEEIIFELDELPGTIHNGGSMHFGLDGKLYISVGDGAIGTNASDLSNLLGKVLRINDDGSIPTDNPFLDVTTGKNRAIWAYGFRNSFSTAINPLDGSLFGCDVGGSDFEEVNRIEGGGFYGWPDLEGFSSGQNLPENYTEPLYAYDHDNGCAIIGAAFYSPDNALFPERYHNKFFFGDYCEGYIKVLNPTTGQIEETFARDVDRPVSFLVSPDGDMYYLARGGLGGGSHEDNTSSNDGSLWKISFTGSGEPFISKEPEDQLVPIGETAVFEVFAGGVEPLTFDWYLDEELTQTGEATILAITETNLAQNGTEVYCIVSNEFGADTSEVVTLSVTENNRPIISLSSTSEINNYNAGDTIFFEGLADDPEDGVLSPFNMTWWIDFHHDNHTHPAMSEVSGLTNGFFVVPRVGEIDDNVWYRIYLSAIDSEGLDNVAFIEVFPNKTTFTILSEPEGLEINVDGQKVTTPASITSVTGLIRTLEAKSTQQDVSAIYCFEGWELNSGDESLYTFIAGEEQSIKANYDVLSMQIGEGEGLTADFYDGLVESNLSFKKPISSRIDPQVDFNFEGGGPIPEVGVDNYMIRWRGEIMAPLTDEFTFYVTTDDGQRLWINDELIIDQWIDQGATTHTGTYRMEAGKKYKIRMDFYEAYGGAMAKLEYGTTKMQRVMVPQSQLFPDTYRDLSKNQNVTVYPNPSIGDINIEIGSWFKDRVDYGIYTVDGRTIQSGTFRLSVGTNVFTLDGSAIPSGVYYLNLEGARFLDEDIKFVKE